MGRLDRPCRRADPGSPAVLCLCEVALGEQCVRRSPDTAANNARKFVKKDSVYAPGLLVPDPAAGFLDHGGAKIPLGQPVSHVYAENEPQRFMGHNEYIVYEEARHKIKFGAVWNRQGPCPRRASRHID